MSCIRNATRQWKANDVTHTRRYLLLLLLYTRCTLMHDTLTESADNAPHERNATPNARKTLLHLALRAHQSSTIENRKHWRRCICV